jgi:hypothetical protein
MEYGAAKTKMADYAFGSIRPTGCKNSRPTAPQCATFYLAFRPATCIQLADTGANWRPDRKPLGLKDELARYVPVHVDIGRLQIPDVIRPAKE